MKTDIAYRVNHRIFMQYYRQERMRLGSERKVAERVGVSHTTVQMIRKQRDDKGRPKRYVNLATARLFEEAWGIPRDVCFVPEVVEGRPTAA